MTYSYTCPPTRHVSHKWRLEQGQRSLVRVQRGRDPERNGEVAFPVTHRRARDERYPERDQPLEQHVEHVLAGRRRVVRSPEVRLGEVADHETGDALEPSGAEQVREHPVDPVR